MKCGLGRDKFVALPPEVRKVLDSLRLQWVNLKTQLVIL